MSIGHQILVELTVCAAFGAYDLLERISKVQGRRLHPNTIYRALADLRASGEVIHVTSLRKYVRRAPGIRPPLLMLVCRHCNAVEQLEAHAFASAVVAKANDRQFRATSLCLEVLGRCASCAAADQ